MYQYLLKQQKTEKFHANIELDEISLLQIPNDKLMQKQTMEWKVAVNHTKRGLPAFIVYSRSF